MYPSEKQLTEQQSTSDKPRVLFVCTGNCCRSPLAEGILRSVAGDRIEVASAGVNPAGFIHPLTLAVLDRMGVRIDDLVSTGLSARSEERFDVMITLCDYAAAALPPGFQKQAVRIHFPLPDPSFHPGSEEQRELLCDSIAAQLKALAERIVSLDIGRSDKKQIQSAILELVKAP